MLLNKSLRNGGIHKFARKYFHLMTPEEYFVNMKESLRKLGVDSAKLLPLPEASKNYLI
jgi:hypothetical protein